MRFARFFLSALALTVAREAPADTVHLRRSGNATVIPFEYITQDETTIIVKRQDNDTVLTYKWEDLDQDWIRKNNPKVWSERQLLLAASKPDGKTPGIAPDADPFAQQATATDIRSLTSNLLVSLQDGMKGMSLSANRVDVVCAEFQMDEGQFWLGFDDLKRASLFETKPESTQRTGTSPEEPRDADPKTKTKGKPSSKAKVRSAESMAAEAAARKDFETGSRPYNTLGYLRMLAEGGTKAKPAWMMLRRSATDRETMRTTLLKHAKQAGELSEKPEGKASRTELLLLRKALENCAESVGRITRETIAVEGRLQSDCRAVLTLALR